MNITIVCGHYLPLLGYIEVHLARAMAAIGHQVTVITTSAVPAYVRHIQKPVPMGVEMDGEVRLVRLRPFISFGQIVLANGLNRQVVLSKPDLIFVIGLGKRFPKPVFKVKCRIITLLGDNDYSYSPGSTLALLRSKLLFRFLKKSVYEQAVKKSAAIVAYTPQSFDAAAGLLSAKYREKLQAQTGFISLGFWPEEFHFDPELRLAGRAEMGFGSDQKVVITTTRVVPEKNLGKVIYFIKSLPENWIWLVVGTDQSTYSQQFVQDATSELKNRFHHLSFQNRAELPRLYNLADIAIYTQPAISIFESLGSGLPCVMPHLKSLEHILEEGFNGFYFEALEDVKLYEQCTKLDFSGEARSERADVAAHRFSWNFIAEKLCKL